MQNYIILSLVFVASLLESTFVPIPLTLLILVAYGVLSERAKLSVAFFSGVLLDLFNGRTIGVDSLIFVLVVYLISMYRKKIVTHTFYYLVPFWIILIVLYNVIFFKNLNITIFIFSLAAAVLLFFLVFMSISRFEKTDKLNL
ncbi:rod shape-determining protein MreD [Candidatus Gottesmanbacteria bacterium]|nr:rod shape-determining protein MreD [Candidatus Gottesmanbacteria bacterium]